MTVKTKSNELRLMRVYNAPIKAVWDAWTDSDQVAQWWGPRGFTLTTHSKDLKVGGHWTYTMHGPDGVDYKNTTKYFEVEKYAKLVYDHGGNEESKPLFRVTALFKEIDGKTHLDMCMGFETPEAAETTSKFIKQAGGNTTWDRLAEYLEKNATGKETFVINRTFNAPLETMFEMWTNPEHLAKWAAPAGFELTFIRADLRPGGSTFSVMSNSAGNKMLSNKMYGRAEYLAIEKPNRITYTQQFCDENEKLVRHPMAPTWPATMLTTVELTSEGKDQTRVTLTWECHGETTKEELETFINARSGMTQGWTGSFDKLEDYLSAIL